MEAIAQNKTQTQTQTETENENAVPDVAETKTVEAVQPRTDDIRKEDVAETPDTGKVAENIPDVQGKVDVALKNEPQPVGRGAFGDIYDQFKGKAKEAFNFLISRKSGDLLGVFHRNEIGDIDVIWGDRAKDMGLDHIIAKHIGNGKSFATIEEAVNEINKIISNGTIDYSNADKIVLRDGSKLVTIRRNVRQDGKKIADKNWVLTAYDKLAADGGTSAITTGNQVQAAPDTANSTAKVAKADETSKASGGKVAESGESGEKVLGFDKAEVAKEVAKAVEKAGIYDFVSQKKDEPHTALKGVFHDRGYLIGCDSRVIVSMKGEYPNNLEGEITDKKGGIVDAKPNKNGVKYPNWERVLPEFDENQLVSESIDNIIEAAMYAENLNKTLGEDVVAVTLSNGKGFKSSNLLKAATMAKKLGYNIITISPDKGRPLVFRKSTNGKEFVGCMPLNFVNEQLRVNSNDMSLRGGLWYEAQKMKLPKNEQEKAMFDNALNQLLKTWGKDEFSSAYGLKKDWSKNPPKYKDFFNKGLLSDIAKKGKPEVKQYFESLMNQNVPLEISETEAAKKPSARTRKMVEAGEAAPTAGERAVGEAVLEVARESTDVVADKAEMQRVLNDAVGKQGATVEDLQKMTVWHGSPYSFEAFDHSKMGTGEGAQAHGWGTYVAKDKEVGRSYALSVKEPNLYDIKYNGKHLYEDENRKIAEVVLGLTQWIPYANSKERLLELYDSIHDRDNEAEDRAIARTIDISKIEMPPRFLYDVEIPDDNGKNYLDEQKEYTIEEIGEIVDRLNAVSEKQFSVRDFVETRDSMHKLGVKQTENGRAIYERIGDIIMPGVYGAGYKKAVSDLLSKAGFVGIKYDGRQDGECYVIFNEGDAKIVNRTQFLRTRGGEVYGFVKDGKMYVDPDLINPETPLHEYGHLWDEALRANNGELWARWKELVRGSELWQDVVNDENYADIRDNEDLVASEVKSRLTGKGGAERLQALVDEAQAKGGVIGAAEKVDFVARVKNMLKTMWEATKQWFADSNVFVDKFTKEQIRSMSVEDFVNKTLNDFAEGVNPVEESRKAQREKSVTGAMVAEIKEASPKLSATEKSAQDFKGNAYEKQTPQLSAAGEPVTDFRGDVSSAKVRINRENRSTIYDNFTETSKKVDKEDIPASYFLQELQQCFRLPADGTGYVRMDVSDAPHTLRISGHSINAKNNTKNSEKRNFDSIVIKVAKKSHFTPADDVELTEYVYYPKLLTREKQQAIIKGLQDWLYTGEYNVEADRVNISPKEKVDEMTEIAVRDDAYRKAVESGDMETAQKLLQEEADRKGYSQNSDYQGTSAFNGSAPSSNGYYETEAEAREAIANGDFEGDISLALNFDEDVMGLEPRIDARALAREQRGNDVYSRARVESIKALRKAREEYKNGNKNSTIKMYRSVPAGVNETAFRNGDWITPSRIYAEDNADIHANYEGEGVVGWDSNGSRNIIEMDVPIKDVWWDGNDINEFGYDDGKNYAYKNTANNRKLFDVTYDENGNLIPLSERFNESKNDAQYRFVGEKGAENADKAEGTTVRMDNLKVAEEMEREYKDLVGSEEHNRIVEASKRVKELKPIKVEAHDMSREEQKAKYVGFGDATNKETGVNVKFFSNAFDKNHREGGLFEKAVPQLKDGFENAVFAYSEPEKLAGTTRRDGTVHKEHRSVRSYDNYVNKLNIDGKDYYVRYTVQMQPGQNGIHSQFIRNVELYDAENPTKVASYRASSGPARLDFNEISDAKLRNFFNLASETEEEFAKKIKLATGWERGTDGKWRYEEPDFDVDIRGRARQYEISSKFPYLKEFESLMDKGKLSEDELLRLDELTKMYEDYMSSYMESEKEYLDDYVIDKNLFKEYPELKQTKLVFVNYPNLKTAGAYSEKDNCIYVNTAVSEDTRTTLAHEVQHAIQRIEGFATGGNSRNNADYRRLAGEVEARNVQERLNYSDEQRRQSLASATEDVPRDEQAVRFGGGIMADAGVPGRGANETLDVWRSGMGLREKISAAMNVLAGKQGTLRAEDWANLGELHNQKRLYLPKS